MTALLFHGGLADPEHLKAMNPGAKVQGFSVFQAGVLRALMSYSTIDKLYVVKEEAEGLPGQRLEHLSRDHHKSVRVVSAHSPEELLSIPSLVILSTGPDILPLALMRAQHLRHDIPIVGVTHTLVAEKLIRSLSTALNVWLFSHDALVCSSRSARRVVEQILDIDDDCCCEWPRLAINLPVIPLGVHAEDFMAVSRMEARARMRLNNDAVVLLYFGRLSSAFKADLVPLIIAMRQLSRTHHNLKCVIAGDDTEAGIAGSLRALARDLGCGTSIIVQPDVTFHDKQILFAAADVFVSLSDHVQETFGITVLEAMAAGLPVVASDWSGYKDIVDDGRTGFLVPTYFPCTAQELEIFRMYGGSPNEQLLANRTSVDMSAAHEYLSVLLDNSERRHEMGAAARAKVQSSYHWRRVVPQYDELWAQLIKDARQAPPPRQRVQRVTLQRVFGSYPTLTLQRHTVVEATGAVSDEELIMIDYACRVGGYRSELASAALSLLRHTGRMTIGQLTDEIVGGDITRDTEVGYSLVSRLIKYGLVKVSRIREVRCQAGR